MAKRSNMKVWYMSPGGVQREIKWIEEKVTKLGKRRIQKLAREAAQVRENAYQPYSGYHVGASLITLGGETFSSCNTEAVTYTETDHAEKSTITQAIAKGAVKKSGRKFIDALAVSHSRFSAPCGACRQRIAEHADNALIIMADEDGNVRNVTSLRILLPYAFTPTHLRKD